MARILYGVMGNTYGHVVRSLALARRMPGHEFHFVGGGRVPEVVGPEYPVLEVPVLRTVHARQSVSVPAVVGQIAARAVALRGVVGRIRALIDEWQPDVAFCDREFYLPIACRGAGLRCVSVNHSRILLACRYPVPASQRLSWALAMANDKLLFDTMREHISVSFYDLPVRDPARDEIHPPVLREQITRASPRDGDHVLVYQTSPTFGALLDTLKTLPRPVIAYGFGPERTSEGNVSFKPFDAEGILEDLAGCSYAVVNGGHNLIAEALYLGKPVLCFPIRLLFEQFLNAYHVRELGYGDLSTARRPDAAIFEAFERGLPAYRERIAAGRFDGTASVVARLEAIAGEAGGPAGDGVESPGDR